MHQKQFLPLFLVRQRLLLVQLVPHRFRSLGVRQDQMVVLRLRITELSFQVILVLFGQRLLVAPQPLHQQR